MQRIAVPGARPLKSLFIPMAPQFTSSVRIQGKLFLTFKAFPANFRWICSYLALEADTTLACKVSGGLQQVAFRDAPHVGTCLNNPTHSSFVHVFGVFQAPRPLQGLGQATSWPLLFARHHKVLGGLRRIIMADLGGRAGRCVWISVRGRRRRMCCTASSARPRPRNPGTLSPAPDQSSVSHLLDSITLQFDHLKSCPRYSLKVICELCFQRVVFPGRASTWDTEILAHRFVLACDLSVLRACTRGV